MIIRLNKNHLDKSGRRFYLNFSDYNYNIIAIFEKGLNQLRPFEVKVKYRQPQSETLGFFYDDDSFDNEYDGYNEYDVYDESELEVEKMDTAKSLDLYTPYICFDGSFLYELYALNNDEEIVVLLRPINFEYNRRIQYEELMEDDLLYDATLLFDCKNSRIYNRDINENNFWEGINDQQEDTKFYIITSDSIIYMFNCIDFFEDPNGFFESEYEFSMGKAVIKESYSLEELLEIEKKEKSCSEEEKKLILSRKQNSFYE